MSRLSRPYSFASESCEWRLGHTIRWLCGVHETDENAYRARYTRTAPRDRDAPPARPKPSSHKNVEDRAA